MQWTPSPLWDKSYQAVEQEAGIPKHPEELAAETAIWKLMYPYFYDDPLGSRMMMLHRLDTVTNNSKC